MRDGMTRWERRRNAEEKVNSMADGFVASNNLLEDARYSWKKNPQLRTLIRRALAIAGERRGMSPGQISQMLDQLEPPPTRFAAHPCSNPGPEWNRDGACENCWINWARRVVVE
jgi:hypothetical protein